MQSRPKCRVDASSKPKKSTNIILRNHIIETLIWSHSKISFNNELQTNIEIIEDDLHFQPHHYTLSKLGVQDVKIYCGENTTLRKDEI